ncbi:MAG: ABC transporter permease [Gemmatimonadales bacterium]
MRWLTDLWFRVRALLRPRAMERELDDELDFHHQMQTEKLIREGVAPEDAARESRRLLDGAVRPRQEVRDAWGVGLLRDFLVDVRHALRQFRRRPAFSVLGILTLGVGLGATIGLFGVISSVLVRPLPIADEAGVRVFWTEYNWRGVEFDFVKERTGAFRPLAAFSSVASTLRGETGSTVLQTALTSAEFFDVLGARPLLGRTFRPGEDRPGAEPVVVLSYGVWRQELGADSAVVGRRIVLDGRNVTVIGVMPRGFYFPTPSYRLWMPLDLDPASRNYQGNGWLVLFGRVRDGLTEAQVSDDIASIARALGERFTYPTAWDKTRGAMVRPVREFLVGEVRPALLLVFGAGALLLLMATASVAALILA